MKKEKEYKINKSSLVLQFVVIIFVLYFVALLTLLYLDNKINEIKRSEIISKEKNTIYLEKKMIERDTKSILGDLYFLEDSILDYLDNNANIKNVEKIWKSFSVRSKKYDQIRFIDNDGNEIIRINYKDEKSILSKQENLQNKKNRYYFIETSKLNQGEIYISKFDLNIEHNKIEEPIKPMIRFATRTFVNNKPAGMVIVNYLAEEILSEFNKISINSYGNLYLLNSNSYWLTGGSETENWAFMYNDRKDVNFKNKYPLEWNKIYSKNKVFITDKGVFLSDNTGVETVKEFYKKPQLISSEEDIKIVSLIKRESELGYIFSEKHSQKFFRIAKENKFLFLLITIISILIEGIIIIYKKTYLKIKYHADHDGLTKAYNRRAGIRMLEEYFEKTGRRKIEKISICFIDVNGLKQVNDILGHEDGDELILTVAEITKKIIREDDFLIRLGGDEFLLVFHGINLEKAEFIWSRVLEEFEKININEKRKYIISVSHGIVDNEVFGEGIIDKIIKKADKKMYEEKKEVKRNSFKVIK